MVHVRFGQTLAFVAVLVFCHEFAGDVFANNSGFQSIPSFGVPVQDMRNRNVVEIAPSNCAPKSSGWGVPSASCSQPGRTCNPPVATPRCNVRQPSCNIQPRPCNVPAATCGPRPMPCKAPPVVTPCQTAPKPKCSKPFCQGPCCFGLPCFLPSRKPAPKQPGPSFMVFKQAALADGGAAADSADDTINYKITVVNTGIKCLIKPNIRDSLTPRPLTPITDIGAQGVLDVGETWTFVTSYRVRQSDIANNGIDMNGHPDNDGDIDNAVTAAFCGVPSQTAIASVPVSRGKSCSPGKDGVEECDCCVHCCEMVRVPYVHYYEEVIMLCADIFEAETISRPFCEANCVGDGAKCRERIGVETIRQLVPRKTEIPATVRKAEVRYRQEKKCVKCGVCMKECPDDPTAASSQYYGNENTQPALPTSPAPAVEQNNGSAIYREGGPSLAPQSLERPSRKNQDSNQQPSTHEEKVAELARGAAKQSEPVRLHQPIFSP